MGTETVVNPKPTSPKVTPAKNITKSPAMIIAKEFVIMILKFNIGLYAFPRESGANFAWRNYIGNSLFVKFAGTCGLE